MPETAFKGSRLAKARSQVAVAHRKRDPEAIENAQRVFAVEKIAAYIKRVVADAPEFTPEQRTDLAELLKPARAHIRQSRLAQLEAGDAL